MGLVKDLNKKVENYDFKGGVHIKPAELQRLLSFYQELIEEISKFWENRFESTAEVTSEELKYTNFEDYISNLSLPIVLSRLSIDSSAELIWELPPNFSFFIVEFLLGGLKKEVVVLDRELSAVEKELIQSEINEILPIFSSFFSKYRLAEKIKLASIIFSKEECKFIQKEKILTFPWELKLKDMNFNFSFSLSSISWEAIRKKLTVEKKEEEKGGDFKDIIQKHISKTPLKIKVILGTTDLNVKEFINLQVGDIIRLRGKIEDKLILYIEEKSSFLCSVGTTKGNKLGVRIEAPITGG